MNEHKICVILHAECAALAQRALEGVQRLPAPEGYEIDIQVVDETDSTMEAYQAAMEASDARYKIYLREHTQVLRDHFLGDLLAIFQGDPSIGMIGMVGLNALLPSTKVDHGLWENRHVAGAKMTIQDGKRSPLAFGPKETTAVRVVEDFCVATCVDLPWDSQAFTRAHHGCADHALAVANAGYRVVAAGQKTPWCSVDASPSELDAQRFEAEKAAFLRKHRAHYPPVSIGIPAYDRAEWTCEGIDSILGQTYPNMRVFITDDSPNTSVQDAIRARFGDNPDVHYIRNPTRLGLAGNFPHAHEVLDTEYRLVLPDDDRLPLRSIERRMDYFCLDQDNEISIAGGFVKACDAQGDPQPGFIFDLDKMVPQDIVVPGWVVANHMLTSNMAMLSGHVGLHRASALTEAYGVYNGRVFQCNIDRAPALALLGRGLGCIIHEEVLLSRFHDDQQGWKAINFLTGGNDYFHEVTTARQCGFLQDAAQNAQALKTVAWYYNTFIANFKFLSSLDDTDFAADNLREAARNMRTLREMKVEGT